MDHEGKKIQSLPLEMMVYVEQADKYYPIDKVPHGMESSNLNGTVVSLFLPARLPLPMMGFVY